MDIDECRFARPMYIAQHEQVALLYQIIIIVLL